MLVHELILPEHVAGIVDLGIAGGEMVVPEERDLFAQRLRAVKHTVNPPRAGERAVVGLADASGQRSSLLVECLLSRSAFEEPVDGFFRARLEPGLELIPRRPERGPPIE